MPSARKGDPLGWRGMSNKKPADAAGEGKWRAREDLNP